MINLDATTKSIEIVLGGSVTTNQLPFVSSYVDIDQSSIALTAMTEQDGVTSNTATVTVVTAPGSGKTRVLKNFNIQNQDTVSQTVTVRVNNNGTTRNLVVQALTAGQSLNYDEANGWTLACTSGGGGSSLPDPVTVPHGGTGDTTLTNHGVLLGQGTNSVVATSAGTTGQVLTSNGASADPTFQTPQITDNSIVDFRLTLTTVTPVTTSDVTGATTVYCSPYKGNRIALFDGTSTWNIRTSAEFSIALGTLTNNLPYDVFCYDNSGTPTLEILAWSSTTARATALVLQDGVLVKTGATTRRYLGTFTTTATTTTEDSALKRHLWNYYNRVPRTLVRVESTNSWTYGTGAIRQANGSTSNQVEVTVGYAEAMLDLSVNIQLSTTAGSNIAGIGEDSTTTFVATNGAFYNNNSSTPIVSLFTRLIKFPAIGKHVYSWNEYGGGGTTIWYNTATVGLGGASGLNGTIQA